eukprot:c19401_g1_i1 orf=336-620(-)
MELDWYSQKVWSAGLELPKGAPLPSFLTLILQRLVQPVRAIASSIPYVPVVGSACTVMEEDHAEVALKSGELPPLEHKQSQRHCGCYACVLHID